jgi:hypothetical protein
MIRRRFLLSLSVFALLGCGLLQSSAEQTIQGSWRWEDEKSYLTWTFRSGTFSIEGYPPLRQDGSYQVVSTSEDTIVLHLYDRRGNLSTDPADLTIAIARDGQDVVIEGREFRKQS